MHTVGGRVDYGVTRAICIHAYVVRRWKGVAHRLLPKGDGMRILGVLVIPFDGLAHVYDHIVGHETHHRQCLSPAAVAEISPPPALTRPGVDTTLSSSSCRSDSKA